MAIIEQLGINHTFFYQLIIFVFSLTTLSLLVFKPYVSLLEMREKKTSGSVDLASEIQKKAADLVHQYESRAREVSGEIKTIFDKYREEANTEYEAIVSIARAESQKLIEEARSRVAIEISEAQRKLQEEAPAVAQAILQKLLSNGKRVS